MSRRKFTKELKLTAVERLRAGELVGLLAWSGSQSQGSMDELERKIGQQVLEVLPQPEPC